MRGIVSIAAIAVAVLAAPAAAEPHVVAVTPLATLGSELSSAETRKITTDIETALAGIADVKMIGSAAVSEAIKKAKQQRLASCDGDPACLKDVGVLVGADLVVFSELGGLGDTQIIYLKLIDARVGSELRTTTLDVGALATGAARSAAIRLIDPNRYTGTMVVNVDVQGASVYVNGKLIGKSPVKPMPFAVGTHALRVTHPEYRDFVRFVDIGFDQVAEVQVGLHQFPVIQTDVEGLAPGTRVKDAPLPWYRKWWGVTAIGAAAFTTTFVIARFVMCQGICDPEPDYERPVD